LLLLFLNEAQTALLSVLQVQSLFTARTLQQKQLQSRYSMMLHSQGHHVLLLRYSRPWAGNGRYRDILGFRIRAGRPLATRRSSSGAGGEIELFPCT
jgi:hypothetical protein